MTRWEHDFVRRFRRVFQHYVNHISHALDRRLQLRSANCPPKRQPAPITKTKIRDSLAHTRPGLLLMAFTRKAQDFSFFTSPLVR
jgi:hypothetical protein